MSRSLVRFILSLVAMLSFFAPLHTVAQDKPDYLVAVVGAENPLTPAEGATFCFPHCIPGEEVVQYVDGDLAIHLDGVIVLREGRYLAFDFPVGVTAVLFGPSTFDIVTADQPNRVFSGAYFSAYIFRGQFPTELRAEEQDVPDTDIGAPCINCTEIYYAAEGLFVPYSVDPNDPTLTESPNCASYDINKDQVVIYEMTPGQWAPAKGPLFLKNICHRIWIFDPII